MDNTNNDSEFDAFLREVSDENQSKIENAFRQSELEAKTQEALEAAHYEPLLEGSERYKKVWDQIEMSLRDHHDSDVFNDEFEEYVTNECMAQLKELAMREDMYIALVQMLHVAINISDETNTTPATIRQAKMGILADMTIEDQIPVDAPLIKFVNDFAPGGPVAFDDPDMESHYVESLEKVANKKAAFERNKQLMHGAYEVAGIESRYDEEARRIQGAIHEMMLTASFTDNSERGNANRQEALRKIAREARIDLATTQNLVAYFEEMFPIENE